MSAELNQAIHEHAFDHERLWHLEKELDYMPATLTQQAAYPEDLERGLQKCIDKTDELTSIVKKERKEHEDITGKLNAPYV